MRGLAPFPANYPDLQTVSKDPEMLKNIMFAAALLSSVLSTQIGMAAEKVLTIGRPSSINGLDPGFLTGGTSESIVVDNIFDTLVARDSDMKLVPGLATSWKAIDDTTWEFTLRQGVKFHNGEDFDARSVKVSLDRVLDPEAKSPTVSYIRTIEAVEIVDPRTVRIITNGPDPLLPTRMSRYPSYIVPADYATSVSTAEFARKPVGTGPYKFVEFIPDRHVILEANADYWRGKPRIDRVVWRPIPDSTARLTSLLTGEVDLIESMPSDLTQMVVSNPDIDLVQVKNGGLTIYLGLVTSVPPLDNVKVRQALNIAIDRKTIVDNVLNGMASVRGTQVGPADFGYLDIPAPKYDPQKAKQLLAEAGYPDGFDITLQASRHYMKDDVVAQAIAQQFAQIGVKANLDILDWSVYIQQVPRKGPIFMLGWGSTQTLDADAAVYPILRSNEPYSTVSIPELDELLDASRRTVDPAERQEIYAKVQELSAEQVPLITLYQEDALYAKRANVEFSGRPDARIPIFDIDLK